MIYILILFFTSLISIVFMIGRKLILLKNGQVQIQDSSFEIPYMNEIKNLSIGKIKEYEHAALVLVVRFYLQFSNYLKNKYAEIKNKIQNRRKRNTVSN